VIRNQSVPSLEEQVGVARARAGLYRLLARVFGQAPTSRLIEGLKDEQMLRALAAFGVSFDDDFLAGEEKAQAEEAGAEFARLFVGPGPHLAPYESVYVRSAEEEGPRLWGRATVEVTRFYDEAGLKFPQGRIPDHLALEFEAMALLAEAEADQRRAGGREEAQRLLDLGKRFAKEHLLCWVPDFCQEVKAKTKSSFYRNMAVLAGSLVIMDGGEGSII